MLEALHKSMLGVGISEDKIEFSEIESCGNWRKNVILKPEFMLEKCKKNPDWYYAWIDADALVLDTEKKKCGVALPFFENFTGFWGMANEYIQGHSRGFLGNAFIVRSCPAVWKLLEAWSRENHVVITPPRKPRTPDQTAFKSVWRRQDWGFEITEVPTGYVWFEPHAEREPYKSTIPIIRHDIASRETINREKGREMMFKNVPDRQMPAAVNGIFEKTLKRKEAEERETKAAVVVKKPNTAKRKSSDKYAKKIKGKAEGKQGESKVDKMKNK